MAPPGGQLFNYRKWCHLVIKFSTNARIVKEVIIVKEVTIAKEVIIVTEVKMLKKLKTVKEVKIVKEVKVVSPVAMFIFYSPFILKMNEDVLCFIQMTAIPFMLIKRLKVLLI